MPNISDEEVQRVEHELYRLNILLINNDQMITSLRQSLKETMQDNESLRKELFRIQGHQEEIVDAEWEPI